MHLAVVNAGADSIAVELAAGAITLETTESSGSDAGALGAVWDPLECAVHAPKSIRLAPGALADLTAECTFPSAGRLALRCRLEGAVTITPTHGEPIHFRAVTASTVASALIRQR